MNKTPALSSLLPISFALALLPALACGAHAPPASVVHVGAEAPLAQVVGEGRLSSQPEYIELAVTVHAECFAKPGDASAAADAEAARILGLMRAHIDPASEGDGVLGSGGFTAPFKRHVERHRVECSGTFQKVSTLVLKTSKVQTFPAVFSKLQADMLGDRKPAAGESPRTFVKVGQPQPRLTHQTRERLEKKALGLAVENAREKYDQAIAPVCGESKPQLVKFVERNASDARPISYKIEAAQTSGAGDALALDAIWINKLLEVYFEIDRSSC